MPLTKVSSGVIAANAVVDSFGTQSITGDKLGLTAINANNIVGGSITGAKLAANTVSGDVIGQNAISSNNIVSVSGSTITANTVANSAFQTGSVESYMRANNLDFGMRNRIINGDMRIDQRNAGAAVSATTDYTYTLDRWDFRATQSAKFTVQQDSSANTVAGFTSSLKITSSSSYSVVSSDFFDIEQRIEGFNIGDLGFGTANAKSVTLSFWVRSSLTGTFGGALKNQNSDRSYLFSYTIVAANTWEQKFITVAGDQGGTWLTNNSIGLMVQFSLGAGSTFSGTVNTWNSGNYYQPTGATSVVGTNGATWYVTGVQLEEGSTPTSFEYRSIGTELGLCQRYYHFLGGDTPYQTITVTVWYSSTEAVGFFRHPVQMRATPTIGKSGDWATLNGGTGLAGQTVSADQNGPKTTQMGFAGGSSGNVGYASVLRVNNDSNFRLTFSAEL